MRKQSDREAAAKLFHGGSRWTDETTRVVLPLVLQRAMWVGKPVEYGELNEHAVALGRNSALAIAYRSVAGRIGDICRLACHELGRQVPPLNVIIINRATGLPSHGVDDYLAGWRRVPVSAVAKAPEIERADWVREAQEQVWNFENWHDLCRLLNIAAPKPPAPNRTAQPIAHPSIGRFAGNGPESQAHKDLKAWIAKRPRLFSTYGRFGPGRNEVQLDSGDEVDVLFHNSQTRLAIEVKTRDAPECEVLRGIFQCVKYRAILRAMQIKDDRAPNAKAVLVIDQAATATVSRLAAQLSVIVRIVNEMKAMER